MFLDFIRVFQVWNTPPPANVQIQVIEKRADYMPLSLFIRQTSKKKKKEMQVDTECPQVPCRITAKRPAVVLQLVEKHRAAFSVNTGLRAGTPTPK